jgi:hypothetical protein
MALHLQLPGQWSPAPSGVLSGSDLRLDRAGALPLVQDEPVRRDGDAHGRPDAQVLVDGDLPAVLLTGTATATVRQFTHRSSN